MRYAVSFYSDLQTIFPVAGVPTRDAQGWDGVVEVVEPIEEETTLAIVAEENRACMQEMSVVECMDRLGSYGIRRLYTYYYSFIEQNGWEQPDWMSHPNVQKQKFLDLTLPMSHGSTAFEIYDDYVFNIGKGLSVSAVKQVYDIYQQLRLGVRALDIPVAYNTRTRHIYGVNGMLTISLVRALGDIRQFLEEFPKEVVLLDLRMGTVSEKSPYATLAPLQQEAENPKKLPGQMVHDLVVDMLGEFIADYDKLSQLRKEDGDAENPTIAAMVSGNARAVYFWEGQQVLCTSVTRCLRTPGWQRLERGQKFAFGAPMVMGTRPAPKAGRNTKVFEPLCINPSQPGTRNEDPVTLVTLLRTFAMKTQQVTGTQRPSCYPMDTELPQQHEPPLLHRLDAFVTFGQARQKEIEELLTQRYNDFVHGEALTIRSTSERVNYLLLLWFFLKGNANVYKSMNLISMDNVHPTILRRIIAAVQDQPECGYVLHCKESGSCFAADLHGVDDETCTDQPATQRLIWNYADGCVFSWQVRYGTFLFAWLLVKFLLVHACLKQPAAASDGAGKLGQELEDEGGAEGGPPPPPPSPPPPVEGGGGGA